jgi:hypothetical protein
VVRALGRIRGVVLGGARRARERGRHVDDHPAAARARIEVRLDLRALLARQTTLQETDDRRLG